MYQTLDVIPEMSSIDEVNKELASRRRDSLDEDTHELYVSRRRESSGGGSDKSHRDSIHARRHTNSGDDKETTAPITKDIPLPPKEVSVKKSEGSNDVESTTSKNQLRRASVGGDQLFDDQDKYSEISGSGRSVVRRKSYAGSISSISTTERERKKKMKEKLQAAALLNAK